MNLEDYIQRRNAIHLAGEAFGEPMASTVWTELGVANRHIERVHSGQLKLKDVEKEIQACLLRVTEIIQKHTLEKWEERVKQAAVSLQPQHPHNLHFYEARLDGQLRIFDIFRDKNGLCTLGEIILEKTRPITQPMVPPTNCLLYVHVNYGWNTPWRDPDDGVMAFAGKYGLTDLKKIIETKFLQESFPVVTEQLKRLLKERP